MPSDEDYRQALEQIQNVIDRQASNSFRIKGWTVTLVVAVLLFRSKDVYLLVAFIPLIGFWYLDAYYLRQEKLFRKLYDKRRTEDTETRAELFDMNLAQVDGDTAPTLELMVTTSMRIFYLTITGLLVIYSAVVLFSGLGAING